MVKNNYRNISVDIVRFLAAFCIVFIHTCSNGTVQMNVILPITRFAVPIFFMYSGYFYEKKDARKKVKQIKKVSIILFASIILYYFEDIVYYLLGYTNQISMISFDKIVKFLLFNEPGISPHLWFLSALIYVMIIEFFLKLCRKKFAVVAIIVLLFCLYFLCDVLSVFNMIIPEIYYRNFLFEGLPFFIIGELFSAKTNYNIPKKNCYFVFVFSVILTIFENRFLYFSKDIYIGTILFTIILFVYSIFVSNKQYNLKVLLLFSRIGCKYSLGIYIIHPLVMHLLNYFNLTKYLFQDFFINSIVVFAISLLFSVLYYRIKAFMIKLFRKVKLNEHY